LADKWEKKKAEHLVGVKAGVMAGWLAVYLAALTVDNLAVQWVDWLVGARAGLKAEKLDLSRVVQMADMMVEWMEWTMADMMAWKKVGMRVGRKVVM
jgi:hypothetical protein